MDEPTFWALIAETTPDTGAGTAEHVERLTNALTALTNDATIGFQVQLEIQAGRVRTRDHWAVAYIAQGGCSDDGFEYFRMWLIAQGREYVDAAVLSPARAADRIQPGDMAECEELDYAAAQAWEARNGTEFPYDRVDALVPTRDADVADEPWSEDEVEQLFPELARRFATDEDDAAKLRLFALTNPEPDLQFVMDAPDCPRVIVKGLMRSEYLDAIRARSEVSYLVYSPGRNRACDLAFLRDLPQIKGFTFGFGDRCDISALADCPWMERLVVWKNPGTLALERMTSLRSLGVMHRKWSADDVLAAPWIEELHWQTCHISDFTALAEFDRLRVLNVEGGALESTRGLERLTKLHSLHLYGHRKLEEIVGLGHLVELETLAINGGRALPPPEDLGKLRSLRRLELDVNGEIATLTPLAACPSLRTVTIQRTTIADGRIAFLADLPNIAHAYVSPSRGYDISSTDLRKLVAARSAER